MKYKKLNNHGETMLEMVISVAIFALLISSMAYIFSVANQVEVSNFDARNEMNDRLTQVCNAKLSDQDSLKNLNVSSEMTIQYSVTMKDGSNNRGQYTVKGISDSAGGFEKIVIVK